MFTKKKYDYTNILTLTNEAGLVSDSTLRAEVPRQTKLLDSVGSLPYFYFRRAVSYFQLRNYDHALTDLNATLAADSGYIAAWFSRANARYELIQIINSREDYQQQDLIILQHLGIGPEGHIFRHAIYTTKVAVICETDT